MPMAMAVLTMLLLARRGTCATHQMHHALVIDNRRHSLAINVASVAQRRDFLRPFQKESLATATPLLALSLDYVTKVSWYSYSL